MKKLGKIVTTLWLLPALAAAQDHSSATESAPYAGLQSRSIKSLSEADIEELQRGGGWGLALPAELNGKPGPAHLLEHSEEIGLSEEQIAVVTEIYEEMRAEAIAAGQRLIAAEAALSEAFEDDGLQPDALSKLVKDAEDARADLRFVHLSRHLMTDGLLTSDQIDRYQVVRGYASDPCDSVPEGHDPEKWKRHNGCS